MALLDALVAVAPDAYALACFFGLALVAAAEAWAPRRALGRAPGARWARNLAISALDVALVRAVFPVIGISAALVVAERGWGLASLLSLPTPVAFVVGVVALDLGRWLQHRLLHGVPWLWRLHAIHHSDPEYDFSTSLRFHPLEAIYTAVFNVVWIGLVGPPAAAVVLYEIVAVAVGAFAHGNLALPTRLDRWLRRGLVTPDLHRVHHSIDPAEQGRNFAGVCPAWDRLFGTYQAHPAQPHESMEIGLRERRDPRSQTLLGMLTGPFEAMGDGSSRAAVPLPEAGRRA